MQIRLFGKKLTRENQQELLDLIPVGTDSLDMRFSTFDPTVLPDFLSSPKILALKELIMPYCRLENNCIKAFVDYIEKNTGLQKLDLRHNAIKSVGAIQIKEALVKHFLTHCSLKSSSVHLDDFYANEMIRQMNISQTDVMKQMMEVNPLILDLQHMVSQYLGMDDQFSKLRGKAYSS